MKKILEKFAFFLHKKYGITPDILTQIKIFTAPWLALLMVKVVSGKSLRLAIVIIILYILAVATDFFSKILTRTIPQENILSQISGKILIIFCLIPFGFNLFTFFIVLAESVLVFQTIHSPGHREPASRIEKIKMVLQTLLIPILILQVVTSIIPEMIVYLYIIATIVFTYIPIYSRFFYFEK
jgi:phosphatidylglycerophosphate synthase